MVCIVIERNPVFYRFVEGKSNLDLSDKIDKRICVTHKLVVKHTVSKLVFYALVNKHVRQKEFYYDMLSSK